VHRAELEDHPLVLRPVFWLSFLVDDFLADRRLLDTVLMTSALSRAAIGIAHPLSRRGVRTVGLTSAERRPFVEALQLDDEVRSYHQVDSLPPAPTVLVDVAGNQPLRDRIIRRHGATLAHPVIAGFTHREAVEACVAAERVATTFLFVPDRLVERATQRGWPTTSTPTTRTSFAASRSAPPAGCASTTPAAWTGSKRPTARYSTTPRPVPTPPCSR
jgi:Protein of unknown function (DUF2855)